jgi:hypothetical protein
MMCAHLSTGTWGFEMGKTKEDKGIVVLWKSAPQEHDYPAAESYLSLIASDEEVDTVVQAMRQSKKLQHFKAKDILRAARLPLLGTDNPHVSKDLAKIRHGDEISPILLVRGSITTSRALQIADGYHRVCACYHNDENTDIPCVLVTL